MLTLFPLLYFAGIIAIGLSHRRTAATQSDFFLARKSGNVVMVTGSLLATTLGAFGVMGISGRASTTGLVAAWHIWSGVAGMIFLGAWAYRKLDVRDVYTLPELLGRGFGMNTRRLAALLIVFAWLSIIAAQIIAAGKIIHFLGIHSGYWSDATAEVPATVLISIVFIAYTALGGQHSVLRTDLFQAIIIVASLVILVVGVLQNEPAVMSSIDRELLRLPFNENMPFTKWFIIMLTFGVPFLVGPDIYSRLFSGRDETTARRAVISAGILMIPVFFLIAFAGVIGSAVVPESKGDTILLSLSAHSLSPVWLGLMIAALLAAIMSSADTTLLTVSTLVSRDLIGTFSTRERTDASIIFQGRLVVIAAGIFSLLVALWMRDIVKALYFCYQLYSPSVLVPFLYFLFFRRHHFHPASGVGAIAIGGTTAIISIASGTAGVQHPEYLMYGAYLLPAVPLQIDLMTRRHARAEDTR